MYKVLNVNGYEEIMKKYHLSSLASKVLVNKNIELVSKIEEKNSYDYKDMDKVVSAILKSISDKKKIVIYGDYDVDGICSVSILYRTFKLLNYDVGYYVPNRYEDGYGLNVNRVEQFYDKGYSLIICVDNGIKAFDAIKKAKEKRIDVIVLDHHSKEETLPNFDLYLHPEYSMFSEYNMCGASICYYVSKALLASSDDVCLALAGIATIGDVMPLVGQNKLLVKKSLDILNKFKYKSINLLNSNQKQYDENVIGMQIVPKLNSIGRMCKGTIINKLVTYLTSSDLKEIENIASFIEKTNASRRVITEEYFTKLDKKEYKDKIIVEKNDDMLEGINGIIAAHFLNKYKLPSIIFSLDESKEFYKGSARSLKSFNIIELIKKSKYVEFYGGHKGAAGLTIKKENYENFKNEIIELCKDNEYEDDVLEVIEVNSDELSYKSYLDLLKLSPFGEENPNPLFILKNINKNDMKMSKDGKHILLNINNDTNLVGFDLVKDLNNDIISYDVIFKLEPNNLYSNKITCKCIKMEVSEVCMKK